MKIQGFSPRMRIANPDGTIHQDFHGLLSQLITQLQQNLSNEGYKMPQQNAANIAILNNTKSTGALVYDKDNHVLKVNLNGTFKTITTA
jgi:hypothetical protein